MDGKDRDNNSFCSEDNDEYGEEGEYEQLNDILNKLDPETRQRVENGEIDLEELQAMGLLAGEEDGSYGDDQDADYGEEGEFDQDESDEEEDAHNGKRQKKYDDESDD